MVLRDSTEPGERNAALNGLNMVTGGRSIADLVKEVLADGEKVIPTYTPPESARPWLQWKAEHEAVLAERDRLRRRVAMLEGARYEKHKVKPDADGYIPYPAFLIGLLANQNWETRFVLKEFIAYANVSQQEVIGWRERGKVPYYYYEMLDKLPFGTRNTDPVEWTDEMIEMLKEYYSRTPVPQDRDIAEDMNRRLGRADHPLSHLSVHSKAWRLGLLTGIKRAGRRLKSERRATPAQ